MKVIIAGGRDFNDFDLLKKTCDAVLKNVAKDDIEIVSGCANGADKMGEQYARINGYPVKQFPADWDTHGKAAGPIRNQQMADYADALILFWDGLSKGSEDMGRRAGRKGLKIRMKRYARL